MSLWNEEFNKFIGHYLDYKDFTNIDHSPSNLIRVFDADIGRRVGFERVAVHHVTLPSGYRTSSPHAESHEEEFVFVLKGCPDLWLNGLIYSLKEGVAVGFPSGTGIAHTFINNTQEDIHLLVVGESTKNENLCAFPINPELKESCGIWWDDPPTHELGSHNGLPGPIRESEWGGKSPKCVIDCIAMELGKAFHYPGDNETFGNGVRITDRLGLKALGIWYESLPPGRRSAFPHAHTHEEEFIYVIKGTLTVWMDGFVKELDEGCFAAFPSNTGIAHTIINDTDENVVYLCIGETQEFENEKITYPLHSLRERECARKGWLWSDPPKRSVGSHLGKPKNHFSEHLRLQSISLDDAEKLIGRFRDSENGIEIMQCDLSKKAFAEFPEQLSQCASECFTFVYQEHFVGVVHLYVHPREVGAYYVGQFAIDEGAEGSGLVSKCYQLLEDYIKRALDGQLLRLGVCVRMDSTAFWIEQGFKATGKAYYGDGNPTQNQIEELEKKL